MFIICLASIALTATPQIVIDPTFVDFGTVTKGEDVREIFEIRNTGDQPLAVFLMSSCECLFLDENSYSVPPDGSVLVGFRFETEDYDGRTTYTIIVSSDDPDNKILYFELTGVVGEEATRDDSGAGKAADGTTGDAYTLNETTVLETTDMGLLAERPSTRLFFFSYKNCNSCAALFDELTARRGGPDVTVYYYALEDAANKKNIGILASSLGEYPELPVLLRGDTAYAGEDAIDGWVASGDTAQGIPFRWEDTAPDANAAAVKGFNLFAIVAAGLLDGINPCAFTVIILLVSYLTVQFKGTTGRRSVLLSGVVYIVTVFVTYFMIGLGLFEFIQKIQVYGVVSRLLRIGLSAVLFILAGISIYDFIQARRGKNTEMILKLPDFLQNSIRKNIRRQMKDYRMFTGSVILGFVVSVFELACTGQVYLPIIGYMVRSGGTRLTGIMYLSLYNLAFIVPLLSVFLLVYSGISSQKIGQFFSERVGMVKLAFIALFVFFGVLNLMM